MNTTANFVKIKDGNIDNINNFVLELKEIGKTETSENYALLDKEYDTYIFGLYIPENFDYRKDYIIFQTDMDNAANALSKFALKYNISMSYELCEFLNLLVEYYYINNDGKMFYIKLEDYEFETIQEEDGKGGYYEVLKDDFKVGMEEYYLEKLNNKRLNYFAGLNINNILENDKLKDLNNFIERNGYINAIIDGDILKISFSNNFALDNHPLFGETEYGIVQFQADTKYIYAIVNLNKLFAE